MTNPTMPNNIMVGSEKLFRTKAPWRLDSSFIGQLSKDHRLLLFKTMFTDTDYKHNLNVNRISKKLYNISQFSDGHLTFIGLGQDTQVLLDLYTRYGFKFDTAILINNTVPVHKLDPLLDSCAVYNFWTKDMGFDNHIEWAEVNEYVKTKIPAHLSNRLALEVAGCLIYERYELTHLDNNYAKILYV